MWFTEYQTLFHILFIFSLPQHEYLYMKVCILSLLDLSCLWNGFTLGLRFLCWQIFIWFHALPHPPTLRFNNPTDTELFNSGILHSWISSHMFMAGCVCICVCTGVGGWLCAWVRLSSLLLFDGTHCAFMHYSCHAKGATLGQGFSKSMPEPFINSTA